MNRKLFANRDARRKLANMGGIIASSPELLGTAQSFREGGKAISFGRNKLVVFEDGEIYIELPNGDRKKLEGEQLQQAQQIVSSRPEADRAYLDSVISRGANAETPAVSGRTEAETISEETAKQMAVLSKARAGNSLAQIAKDTFLDTADVLNIIAGSAGLLVTEATSLAGDVLSVVTSAIDRETGKTFASQIEDFRTSGRDSFLKEGKVLPRVFDVDFSGDRREEIEQNLKRTLGTTVTPEQRAAIQEQSLAAIERASPETLRDTGESVGITGRASLPNVKTDVTTSVGGLGSIPTSDQVEVSPTGEITGVRTMSGYGDSGIMSQAPGFSVPNVDIGEAGLERAREINEIRKALGDPGVRGGIDLIDQINFGGDNPYLIGSQENKDRLKYGILNRDIEDTPDSNYGRLFLEGLLSGSSSGRPAMGDVNRRALDFYRSDTSIPREEIYSDYLGGDVRAIAKYQGESPEEVQAVSDRLAREAAADEAAKIKQQFGGEDAEAQAQRDAEIAEQQAMLDDDDATLNPSQKIVKEFRRQVDVLKKERADRKKVEEDQGFYTEEDEKIPVKDPDFQELLKGPSEQEEDSEKVIEKLNKAVDKENKKTGGGSPANAGANIFLNAAGVDSSNMTLKEKVTSMKEIYTDLLGYDDEEESELFWLNMAQIGFLVASGQDPNALSNIAAGFAQGASKFAEDKRDRKARDDKMTLAAFSEVMADERAKTKFGYDMQIAAIRAAKSVGTQEPFVDAVRVLAQKGLDSGMYKTIEEALAAADAALRPYYTSTTATKNQAEKTVKVVQNGKTIEVPVSQIPTQQKVLTEEKG